MKRVLWAVVGVVSLSILSGCASAGRSYQYENIPKLKLKEFKIEDADSVFGKPFKTGKSITEEGTFDIFRFEYAFADIGTVRGRVLILEFLNGTLNSYVSNSSFDEDRTVFNGEKIDQVKIGVSTQADAANILGKPHGMAICPSTLDDYKKRCEKASTVWSWMSQRKIATMVNKNMGGSSVFISFDSNGKASNIDLSSSSPK